MDCGGPLGVALGGLVIAYLIAVLGSWRSAFFIAGIATLAMAWLAWHYLRDDPAEHPGVNAAELDRINADRTTRSPKRTARPAEDWASPAAPWSVSSSAAPVGPWCSSAC